jgi:auxin efflux carrier family protein
LLGIFITKVSGLPDWVTPAIAFNNTTSLPLLLVQALSSTGILERLIIKDESTAAVIKRAQSYFLVCSIVSTCLTFSIGPRLIDGEHEPEAPNDDDKLREDDEEPGPMFEDVEEVPRRQSEAGEMTSLLPNWIRRAEVGTERRAFAYGERAWKQLTPRTQHLLLFCYDFLNPPFIGAVMGCIIGLSPPLHRAFFNDGSEGGFLNAWLTSSMSNAGQLFVSLQVVVVGVSLSSGLRKMRRGEASGDLPVLATTIVLVVRFVVWPIVSIAIIWALASKTHLLADDPILWFSMMLMPTGPSAMKLIAMADVGGADQAEKLSISKLLTVCLDRFQSTLCSEPGTSADYYIFSALLCVVPSFGLDSCWRPSCQRSSHWEVRHRR